MNQERQDVPDHETFAEGEPEHLVLAQTKPLPDPFEERLMPENERVVGFFSHRQRMAGVQTLGTMCVTRSAFIQLMTPVSTSATWNSVGTFGFLAPPSTQMTSVIRQAPSVSVTITVMPGLTCRKTGSDLGAATALA